MEPNDLAARGELVIDSVTGVDVSLPIVGAGGRSYAFVIDWHIRFLVALAWWLVATFVLTGGFSLFGSGDAGGDADGGTGYSLYFLVAVLPALAIYFLYHPVLELAMHGRTPGKRMAGVRIVTREGATPGAGAILIRNVFRLVDSLPMLYCLGLVVTFLSAQHARIGDLAAGTLLVYDREHRKGASPETFVVGSVGVDPRVAELIDELLGRWSELDPAVRMQLANKVLRRAVPTAADSDDEAAVKERLKALIAARSQ
jgi:uncharacterized RDD family membrane protein YckC